MNAKIEDPEEEGDPYPPDPATNIAERKLWCAVLERAVSDARGLREISETRGDAQFWKADARAWFKGDGNDVGSFLWVLNVLGLRHLAQDIRDEAIHGKRRDRRTGRLR